MKNVPKKIYLQIWEGCPDDVDFNELDEVTWSDKQIYDNDIEYVHGGAWHDEDLINALVANQIITVDALDKAMIGGKIAVPDYYESREKAFENTKRIADMLGVIEKVEKLYFDYLKARKQ